MSTEPPIDGRALSRALDAAFATWLEGPEAHVLYELLKGSCEVLTRFSSLHDAVRFLHDRASGDYPAKDALLRGFVETYQRGGNPHRPSLLLLGALWPGLSHLFHQHAGRWPNLEDAELWAQITESFLEVATSYNLVRRPHRVAKNLLLDTLRRTLRWLHAHHGPAKAPRARRASDDVSIEMIEAMPYLQALVRGGVLDNEDATILLATRIVGERLPALARQRGASYEAMRKRRQRAERAIWAHLQIAVSRIARRDGLAPSSVSLAEALEEMLRDVSLERVSPPTREVAVAPNGLRDCGESSVPESERFLSSRNPPGRRKTVRGVVWRPRPGCVSDVRRGFPGRGPWDQGQVSTSG